MDLHELNRKARMLDCCNFMKQKKGFKKSGNIFERLNLDDLEPLFLSKQAKIKLISKNYY